jgi:hypothetical protein
LEDCWNPVTERQYGELFGSAGEECIGTNDEPAGAKLEADIEQTFRDFASVPKGALMRCSKSTLLDRLVGEREQLVGTASDSADP